VNLTSLAKKLISAVLLIVHSVPTYACIANPLIGMIAPIGVEWLLLSPWSPFYLFYGTRWLVFTMISIPNFNGINLNPIVGWSLFAVGFAIFLIAFIQFFNERKKGFVKTGLYSAVRHPQYLGIMVATLGFTFTSERPMAWISWLNLVFLYLLLARGEESILQESHANELQNYREHVSFIIPSLRVSLPESRFKRYSLITVVYLLVMTVAWFTLSQFSYSPFFP
jgi:protein-S-isoprenylcysteine O-methyltransferase Ste14